MGALDRFASARLCDHVREGETRQVLAHVVAHVGPYREQDTLTLVVTGPVAVGFAEVARDDRTSTAATISARVIASALRAST